MEMAAAPPALWSRPTPAHAPHAAFRHVIPDAETALGSEQKPVMTETSILVTAARLLAR